MRVLPHGGGQATPADPQCAEPYGVIERDAAGAALPPAGVCDPRE